MPDTLGAIIIDSPSPEGWRPWRERTPMYRHPETQNSCAMMLAIARVYRESLFVAAYGLRQSGKKLYPTEPRRSVKGTPRPHHSQLRSQPYSALVPITAGFLAQEVAAHDPEAAARAQQLKSGVARWARTIAPTFPFPAPTMMRSAPPRLRFYPQEAE